MTWKYHVDESAKGRYDIILGQDLLKYLGLNLDLSEDVIKADDGTFNGFTTPMAYLGMYLFKDLNTGEITPEELFNNAYAEEVYES